METYSDVKNVGKLYILYTSHIIIYILPSNDD